MPKGPSGEKRPADVIGAAIRVTRIATGEEEEELVDKRDAARTGSEGGKRRAANLSGEQRSRIAKRAAELRRAAQSDADKD